MSKYTDFKGSKIYYSVHGTGKAIMLLHGFTESREIWKQFARKLSMSYCVICPDLPGHGRSEALGEVHSMELMAEVVNGIMKGLGISSVLMVGHSMGGYVTLAFAERYPKKLKGFTLFHSHAAADSPEAMADRERTITLIEKNKKGFIRGFIPSLFDPGNIAKFREPIRQLQATASAMTGEAIISALRGMKVRPDRTHILTNTSVPVQFIIGKNDTRIPMEVIIPQALLPAHSEMLILDGVGHMGFLEAKDATYHQLESFARKVLS